MKVKVKIRDKDLKVVEVKEYEFDEFCFYLSRKIKSLLFLIEDYCGDDKDKSSFKDIRNNILDVAGEISRLPNSIEFEDKESE